VFSSIMGPAGVARSFEHMFDRHTILSHHPTTLRATACMLDGVSSMLSGGLARQPSTRSREDQPAPTSTGRSRNMRAIRRTDTKPEIALRSALHRAGYRFRKDLRFDAGGIKVHPTSSSPGSGWPSSSMAASGTSALTTAASPRRTPRIGARSSSGIRSATAWRPRPYGATHGLSYASGSTSIFRRQSQPLLAISLRGTNSGPLDARAVANPPVSSPA
jgi:hypothetical protein